jgi:arsenite methyltransferase
MMTDRWARWVLALSARAATDPARFAQVREFRDNVLLGARVRPGDVLLDVGCGDGLIGFGALTGPARDTDSVNDAGPADDAGPVGDAGSVDGAGTVDDADPVGDAAMVIFSDVSEALLDRCREIAADLGVSARCRFVRTGLPDLDGIETASVDVVTTRSVLIYVEDKVAAFRALYRVLRPGGRLSIFEPINGFGGQPPEHMLWGFDMTGLVEIAGKVKDAYRRHLPDCNTLTDFDERDLLSYAEAVGFEDLHLTYHAYVGVEPPAMDWSNLLRFAPNPLVPPLGEVIEQTLSPAERAALAARMAAEAAAGRWRRRLATAYLTGTRKA